MTNSSNPKADGVKALPCPFCGEQPLVEPSGDKGLGTIIMCMTRGCVAPHVSYYGDGIAVSKWNTRTPSQTKETD